MRFQKRIKILPGITLNLSKFGISTSFGVTGARYTIGNGKSRTTIGIPGTGLSHTTIRRDISSQKTILSQLPETAPQSTTRNDADIVICPSCHKKTLASENKCIRCNENIYTNHQITNTPKKSVQQTIWSLISSFAQMLFTIFKPITMLVFSLTIGLVVGLMVAFYRMVFKSGNKRH